MALVLLDRQHTGKPSLLRDLGAGGDLDHDGRVSLEEQEAILTAQYALGAELRLRELGHDVIPISDGSYAARHARACDYARTYDGRAYYVACHLNAGGGAYGACLYDARSRWGAGLAQAVAARLEAACPELVAVHAIGARSYGDWMRAYATIAGVFEGRPVGLCYEPCFIDGPHAADLLSSAGLRRLGDALADGIHAHAQEH